MEHALEIVKGNDRAVAFRNSGLAGLSKEAYAEGVKKYHQYIAAQGLLENTESVLAWFNTLKGTLKPSTVNLRIQGLKDYLLKKYEHNIATHYGIEQVFKGVKLVKTESSVTTNEYLPYNDIKRLSLSLTPIMRLITCTLFWTGCRVSELVNVKVSDCDINHAATAVFVKVVGKGSKERTVQMPVDLYKDIINQFQGKVYLFETSTGKPYGRKAVWQEINRQSKRQGYNIHPHTLRHSTAMYLKQSMHLSADQVCKYLGHSDVAITLKFYYHGEPDTSDLGIPKSGY
ncbi:MAG: tyrosine-type recombinase/integrase [Nitrospirae bacterium]|nr:tyrosine-type recombinase/integrase [Nitrospirota bacterium]